MSISLIVAATDAAYIRPYGDGGEHEARKYWMKIWLKAKLGNGFVDVIGLL